MNNKYQMIIFDWDGTLMDSAPRIVGAMQAAASQVGLTEPLESDVKHIIGLSMDEVFEQLFPQTNQQQRDRLFEAYRYEYVEGDQPLTPLFSGSKDLLNQLSECGYQLAVATGKARRGLDRVLEQTQLGHLFNDSICADEAKSKPDPDMLNILMERQGLAPKQCLMIGDTSYDLAMAASAGIDAIGVSFGAHERHQLEQHRPLHIVEEIKDVGRWLGVY